MSRSLHVLFALVACGAPRAQAPGVAERPTVIVRQAEPADLVGNDDVAIKAACDRLRRSGGGTLVLGPGRYVVRRSLVLPANFVLRGEPGAVLAMPAPVLTGEAAAAGSRELVVAGAHELAGDMLVQLLPPLDAQFFPDGVTDRLELQLVERVEGQRLFLRDGLPFDVPEKSRVGSPLKLLQTHKDGLATIEDVAFEGGRIESIWASSPFGYGEELLGPPGRGVIVRRCRFSDWYGRGVALYYQVEGAIEDCDFERISDEAIDLDHYVEHYRVAGNEVRDCKWGITLNDASRNVIENNHVEGGLVGIRIFWWDKIKRKGINEENVIRGNVVRGSSEAAIQLGITCKRNVVEQNSYEGELTVAEPENTIGVNTRLDPPGASAPAPPR
jgi:parallel beta-helix repeat protein